ncbi:MAG: hypothetical protein JW995_13160 [Melioribacteraceae bacterium]|nr:hypothetical protein [Melioribacteraceae bacterium]
MGWIFGAVLKNGSDILNVRNSLPVCKSFKNTRVQIYYPANKNIISEHDNENSTFIIVSGIGLDAGNSRIFTANEWSKAFSKMSGNSINFEGHYIIIKAGENSVEIFTDPLGLRDIYLAQTDSVIYFSTRIDFLSKLLDLEIDYKVFGSRWLTFNQLSHLSPLKPLQRIVAGGSAFINIKNFQVSYSHAKWLPVTEGFNQDVNGFDKALKQLVLLPFNNNRAASLSLSGGMDSRVILSYLLAQKRNWNTHTFGIPQHPDVVIAAKLANSFGFENRIIYPEKQSLIEIILKLKEYTAQTIVNNSASVISQLDLYNKLKNDGEIIMDGGFGEIWRREFFNRILFSGKGLLHKRDYNSIVSHLKIKRADIFNNDVVNEMFQGCIDDLKLLYESLPSFEKTGLGNWLDLFAIRTRLANYYGPEQSRLDGIVTSYMPFVQLSLLNNIILTPIKLRKNAALFRSVIKRNMPELSKTSLAKGTHFYPYHLTTLQNRLYSVMKKKLNINVFVDTLQTQFLDSLEEYIRDKAESQSVKNNPVYDYNKIKRIIDSYYSGNKIYARELDWWLAFDEFISVL